MYNNTIKNLMYWTKERCIEVAKSFQHKKDFQNAYRGAYTSCQRNNWLEEVCSHMIPKGNMYNKLIYVYEFSDNHAYVGLTYDINKRHNNRMKDERDPVLIHMNKTKLIPIRKLLTNFLPIEEACIQEINWAKIYTDQGWTLLNRAETGSHIGTHVIKWTKEACAEEASKYTSKVQFRINSVSAYSTAKHKKWLNEICSHMIPIKKPNGYWTKEKCREEASKYPDRISFQKSTSAYAITCRNKWLDEFFK